MKKILLGVKIDDVTMDQATQIALDLIKKPGKHYIVTPNPEMLVMAQKDEDFKKVLNSADLSIPDGVGLRLSGDIVMTIPGIDFMEELIKLAEDQAFTIGFLGGQDGVAKKTAECLLKKYPKLKVNFAGGEPGKIPATDILFVAFGPPKQEKWIAANLDKIAVKVAMGVGGSFDYISGKVPRAPLWVRNLGFEWLFRLAVEPWRIKRQLKLLKYLKLLMVN